VDKEGNGKQERRRRKGREMGRDEKRKGEGKLGRGKVKEKGKSKGKEIGKGKGRWKKESLRKVGRTDERTDGHSGDFILCPMLCIALDRQKRQGS